MAKLSENALRAVYDLAQEKAAYDRTIADWRRPSGIAGLFARHPRDPFPEGMDRLRELFGSAFRGVYPGFEAVEAGETSLSDTKARFGVSLRSDGSLEGSYHCEMTGSFHDEHYYFKPGYGLMHAYSHSDDPDKDAANRNLAYSNAMNGRYQDSAFLKRMDAAVDSVRSALSYLSRPLLVSARERRGYIRQVEEFRRGELASEKALDGFRKGLVFPKVGLNTYVTLRSELERIRREVLAGRPNTPELREEFAARQGAADAYRYRSGVDGGLSGGLNALVSPAVPKDELMVFAKQDYRLRLGRNPDEEENKLSFLMEFTMLARRDGWMEKDIMDAVKREANRFSLELSPRNLNVIRGLIENVDYERIKGLESAIARDAAPGEAPGAVTSFRKELKDGLREVKERNAAVMEAAEFVAKCRMHYQKDVLTLDDIAGRMLAWNTHLEPQRIAEAVAFQDGIGVNSYKVDSLRTGLEEAVVRRKVEACLERLEGRDVVDVVGYMRQNSASLDSDPVGMVAKDVASALFYIRDTDPGKLGAFLEETGITFTPVGVPGDIMRTASGLYGHGDSVSARRVMAFREKYAEGIKAGRAALKAADQSLSVSRRNAKGVSLG